MKRIKVSVSQIGLPKVEAEGFHGVGCAEATAPIEKALSGSDAPTTRELKTEWYESEDQNHEKMTW